MSIRINSEYGMDDIGLTQVPRNRFRQVYARFIYLSILNTLQHLYRPNTVFMRGTERTPEIERMVSALGVLPEHNSRIWRVEATVDRHIRDAISKDRLDYYGIYDVRTMLCGDKVLYVIELIGDYRIQEWEEGRGRTLSTPNVDVVTDEPSEWELINNASMCSKEAPSPSMPQYHAVNRLDSNLSQILALALKENNVIRNKMAEGRYVDPADMVEIGKLDNESDEDDDLFGGPTFDNTLV